MKSSTKILSFIIAMVMLLATAACSKTDKKNETGESDKNSDTSAITQASQKIEDGEENKISYEIGDIVEFGSYEQDANDSNGSEKIEWTVLDKKGDKYLLISNYCLEYLSYDFSGTAATTWEESDIRIWLNEDFLNAAFTDNEKSKIAYTLCENKNNPEFGTFGGNNTVDRLFILSLSEVEQYLADNELIVGKATRYVSEAAESNGNINWYFRSPGNRSKHVTGYARNEEEGSPIAVKGNSASFKQGVRPSFWLDLSGDDPNATKPIEPPSQIDETTAAVQINASKNAQIGDEIKFGFYESGEDPATPFEEIEWIVLDRQDGKILVITKNIIDQVNYHEEYTDITWENSDIREWLNNEFLNKAFTDTQKELIPAVNISNPDNLADGTDGGNDTTDQVFLLSSEEAELYFESDESRMSKTTAYADYKYVETTDDNYGAWWLRSPGDDASSASYVRRTDGAVINSGFYVDGNGSVNSGTYFGVRPAMWITVD